MANNNADNEILAPKPIQHHPCVQSTTNPEQGVMHDQTQRVLAKEEASHHAISLLQRIAIKLQESTIDSPDLEFSTWKTLIGSLEQEAAGLRYLVGTGGDTGAGKSSLLNVLVSERADIVPSSQNGACTAAVCCISYPKPGDSQQRFSAKVHMKSKDTVDQELTEFFQELSEFEDRVEIEGGEDPVTFGEREKFNEQLNLICRWSGLSEQRLRDLARNNLALEVTNSCQNPEILFNLSQPQVGLIVQVSGNSEIKFRGELKSYIGNPGRNSDLLRWPLVEMVEVFVKADILRSGVVLVDLPGEVDALEARSQVARKYYNKLDRLMVVATGDRAADNRTAKDLIREDQIMDMEADGKLSDSSLAIIVTKVDQMDWQSFVESEWPSEEIPADIREAMATLEEKQTAAEDANQLIEELTAKLTLYETLGGDAQLKEAKRYRKQIADEIRQLSTFCLRNCVDARSQDIKTGFQEYFDRVRRNMGTKSDPRPPATVLPVFPVSSHAYRQLAKGQSKDAFTDKLSTGVEAVKDWIVEGSLPKREEHSDNIIHRSQVLFDAIGSWAMDEWHVADQLPQTELPRIVSALKNYRDCLHHDILRTTENLQRYLKCLQDNSRLCEPGKIEHLAHSFLRHVQNFQKSTDGTKIKLHWSTYAACIRRRGGPYRTFTKPRRVHCWQSRTYGLFWAPHAVSWGRSFGQQLHDKTRAFECHIQRKVDQHIVAISESVHLPETIKSAFRGYAYKIQSFVGEYKSSIRAAITQYRAATRQIKLDSRERIDELMKHAYMETQKITGRDKHARQIAMMHSQAELLKDTIFYKAGSEVDERIRHSRLSLNKLLRSNGEKLISQIWKMEDEILARFFSLGEEKETASTSPETQKARDSIAEDVSAWRQHYIALKLRLPKQEMPVDEDLASTVWGDIEKRAGLHETATNEWNGESKASIQQSFLSQKKRIATSDRTTSKKVRLGSFQQIQMVPPRSQLPSAKAQTQANL